MIPRPLSHIVPRLARSFSTSHPSAAPKKPLALDRLMLDIHAAAKQDIILATPAEAVTKSDGARRGKSLRGDVQLPRELQDAVDRAIGQCEVKDQIRLCALELYAHLRRTSAILPPPASHRDRAALTQTYDEDSSLAFVAGLMPSIYGATLYALQMAKRRLDLVGEGWEPDRVVDFGCGTASAAWAVEKVWGASVERVKGEIEPREYVGLDASRHMVELASSLLGALPRRAPPNYDLGTIEPVRLLARAHQLSLPASRTSLAKMHLAPSSSHKKRTLALTAFTLGEQGTKEKRKELVRAMWESDAEVIVLVERGTPAGSRIVLEAREQLLAYGERSLEWEKDGVERGEGPKAGSYVLAPCPHDGPCPLHHSSKVFCHFSQRVRSPPFLRHTKHTTRGEDDSKLTYLVLSRGTRPQPSPSPTPSSVLSSDENSAGPGAKDLGAELAWPRLVSPPLKRSGHIILEVCAPSGHLERHTIPKSQGRQEYYDARKAQWGDSFPHAPKNGPQLAPADASASAEQTEEGKKDKFAKGASKLRSKKWERKVGEKIWKDEERRREERARGRGKKASRRAGGSDEFGGGRHGEVREFELDLGSDGKWKVL